MSHVHSIVCSFLLVLVFGSLCSLDLASLIALKYKVMDKSLGAVIQFECFLTHAILISARY